MITTITSAVLLAIIVGLIQCVKELGMNAKWSPVLAIALGVVFQLGNSIFGDTSWYLAVVNGIAMGLASVGLFSGTKTITELISSVGKVNTQDR